MVLGDYYMDAIHVSGEHAPGSMNWLHIIPAPLDIVTNSYRHAPVWLTLGGGSLLPGCSISGIRTGRVRLPGLFAFPYRLFVSKYYFDEVYQAVFAGGARNTGKALWQWGDERMIDASWLTASARAVRRFSALIRNLQTGYLYHYAFAMIIGLLLLLAVFVHQLM